MPIRMSEADAARVIAGKPAKPTKRPKYGATITVVDGIKFRSKREAARYGELKLLEKAGEIRAIILQPRYDLYAYGMTVADKLRRAAARLRGTGESPPPVKVGTYVADFLYLRDDTPVVEDVKGFDTPLAKWKRKHCEQQYGITIRVIR